MTFCSFVIVPLVLRSHGRHPRPVSHGQADAVKTDWLFLTGEIRSTPIDGQDDRCFAGN